MKKCPLCLKSGVFQPVAGPDTRSYNLCGHCQLIFTDPAYHLSKEEEKHNYQQHRNGIQYPGYVNFLNRAIHPALKFLDKTMHGLDFGCGPVPTLSVILEKLGNRCDDYDPIFFPEMDKEKKYDFIFATECLEHFFHPAKEIQQLHQMLRANGILIFMTESWVSEEEFKTWYYPKDPTHVSFFHKRSFDFICEKFGFRQLVSGDTRVVILLKISGSCREKSYPQ